MANHHISAAPLLLALLLNGCATVDPRDTVALTAKIDAKREVAAASGSLGTYQPGQGGAIGGVVAGVLSSVKALPKHYVYSVNLPDGRRMEFKSFDDVPRGECFDVLVEKGKESLTYVWYPKEVALRPSKGCTL
jgi:hypothetical protein